MAGEEKRQAKNETATRKRFYARAPETDIEVEPPASHWDIEVDELARREARQ